MLHGAMVAHCNQGEDLCMKSTVFATVPEETQHFPEEFGILMSHEVFISQR